VIVQRRIAQGAGGDKAYTVSFQSPLLTLTQSLDRKTRDMLSGADPTTYRVTPCALGNQRSIQLSYAGTLWRGF
jgi:hypothetical protein